jgi:hypothetical protein
MTEISLKVIYHKRATKDKNVKALKLFFSNKFNWTTKWDVENIILPFPYNLEFMFLDHFSFVL